MMVTDKLSEYITRSEYTTVVEVTRNLELNSTGN